MLYKFEYLPQSFTLIIPIIILCISLYSYVNNKLIDISFSYVGFPSIWNVVLLYLEILSFNQSINLLIILSFIFLKFVPFKVFHPMRYNKLKKTNVALLFGTLFTSSILLLSKLEFKLINDAYLYFMVLWLILNSYFIVFVIYSNLYSFNSKNELKKNN